MCTYSPKNNLWQIKNDLYSLFEKPKYASIDGMRSISCLLIIFLHIIALLNAYIPSYPHQQWMVYLKSYSFRLLPLAGLALETFFMLSGFLLTMKFIQQQHLFLWKGHATYILTRACRFWPGFVLVTIVMLILDEPEGNWRSVWLFYQNYVSIEQWTIGYTALWSVSLDIQMHILLPLILHLITSFRSNRQRTYLALYILVILSIIYSLFVFNPKTMDLLTFVYRQHSMALLISQRMLNWIGTKYNTTMAFEKPADPSIATPFMELMYLPIPSRYASFVIGSILAFYFIDTKNKTIIHYGKVKKYVYLILVLVFIILFTTSGEPDNVSPIALTIMISIIRQLFTISQAFILFSTICSSTHPYHSPWIKSFLSLSIWTPFAKLSYLIYVLHFRIAFSLIMSHSDFFDPKRFSIDALTLLCLAIVVTICLILSVIWFVLVEQPFQRWINMRLFNSEKPHTH